VLGDVGTKEYVERMEIGDQVDSDRWWSGLEVIKRGGMSVEREGWKKGWNKKDNMVGGRIKKMEEMRKVMRDEKRGVEKEWENMKKRIRNVLGKKETRKIGNGRRGWWNEECREEKRR